MFLAIGHKILLLPKGVVTCVINIPHFFYLIKDRLVKCYAFANEIRTLYYLGSQNTEH